MENNVCPNLDSHLHRSAWMTGYQHGLHYGRALKNDYQFMGDSTTHYDAGIVAGIKAYQLRLLRES